MCADSSSDTCSEVDLQDVSTETTTKFSLMSTDRELMINVDIRELSVKWLMQREIGGFTKLGPVGR